MMNQHWPRWIKASCVKHFDALRQGVFLYVDGMDRDTSKLRDFGEFRMDGPRIRGTSRDEYELQVTINILVQHTMNDNDAYGFERSMGIFQAAFTEAISCFRFGDGNAFLGCLLRQDDVRYNNFGIVDANVRCQQGTLEARYLIELRGDG